MKKVSVIIPTYNKAEYLDLTLSSFINQTYKNFEIIIIDDGSEDNTLEVIGQYEDLLDIKRISHLNQGRAYSRNRGLDISTGEIILFNDDDRIASPNFIETHLNAHLYKNYNIVIGWKHNLLSIWSRDISVPMDELAYLAKKNPHIYDLNKKYGEEDYHYLVSQKDIRNFELARMKTFTCENGKDNFSKLLDYYKNNIDQFHFRWLIGTTANMSVNRELLERVGLFDENFVGWGMEDTELTYRMIKEGGELVLERKAVNYHQYHRRDNNQNIVRPQLKKNIQYFCAKYDNLDCYLYHRSFDKKITLIEANELLDAIQNNKEIIHELKSVYAEYYKEN
ncbi:glycosyltransferase family 2 protein [Paenibacillus tundrae]|uniref:Glycosyltransferase involved in cell wall biosynthesis n=1 Tax=Paenibacillus tundrae TaxID=528187 RepID=A0ABT9WK70_9BACL|nr:glycosyltransferase family 2 protein [Paenibacillus tundrae]MDQ0173387.1 glycosyltransferase involved in cell wall biosynthesis [Paenibacillus tundrae]